MGLAKLRLTTTIDAGGLRYWNQSLTSLSLIAGAANLTALGFNVVECCHWQIRNARWVILSWAFAFATSSLPETI